MVNTNNTNSIVITENILLPARIKKELETMNIAEKKNIFCKQITS